MTYLSIINYISRLSLIAHSVALWLRFKAIFPECSIIYGWKHVPKLVFGEGHWNAHAIFNSHGIALCSTKAYSIIYLVSADP